MMAGEGREPLVEPALEAQRAVFALEIGGEVANERGEIALRDHSRGLAHQDGAGAEGFDDEAERGELVGMRLDQRRRVRVEIDHERGEQRLPLDAAALALALQGLVDDPLVRGVLVDDDKAVRRLGDDIGAVKLRPRRAERRRKIALERRRGRNGRRQGRMRRSSPAPARRSFGRGLARRANRASSSRQPAARAGGTAAAGASQAPSPSRPQSRPGAEPRRGAA